MTSASVNPMARPSLRQHPVDLASRFNAFSVGLGSGHNARTSSMERSLLIALESSARYLLLPPGQAALLVDEAPGFIDSGTPFTCKQSMASLMDNKQVIKAVAPFEVSLPDMMVLGFLGPERLMAMFTNSVASLIAFLLCLERELKPHIFIAR